MISELPLPLQALLLLLAIFVWPLNGTEEERLIRALKSKDASVRQDAAWNLATKSFRSKKVITALTEALKDESPDVRTQAANALQFCGPAAKIAIPALLKTIDDQDTGVRTLAFQALHKIGLDSADAVPQIVKGLRDKDATVRSLAAQTLGTLGKRGRAALRDLDASLHCEAVPSLRVTFAEAILRIAPRSDLAVATIIEAVAKGERGVQTQAIQVVNDGLLPKKPSIEILRGGLSHPDLETRVMAIGGLGRFGRDARSCLASLIKIMHEDDSAPMVTAAMTVLKIDPNNEEGIKALRPSVPLLILELNSQHKREMRLWAVEALRLIAPHSKEAWGALRAAANDQDGKVRKEVEGALRQLRGFDAGRRSSQPVPRRNATNE